MEIIQIILSSIVLSIIHALIPNHWLPLVAIGRAERWSNRLTITSTALAGIAHVSSTIIIGILVGWVGFSLSTGYTWFSIWVAPGILILLGLYYIIRHFIAHSHKHDHFNNVPKNNASYAAILFSLCLGMFFSPCLELEGYYFTAGAQGWMGIVAVSVVYLLVTVSTMVLLVWLALKGTQNVHFQWLEKYEKLIIGSLLLAIGVFTFILKK